MQYNNILGTITIRLAVFLKIEMTQIKSLTVKLNEVECGEFISAFESRHDYSSYHDFDDNKTSIKISPWDKKRKVSFKDPKTQKYENKFVAVPALG